MSGWEGIEEFVAAATANSFVGAAKHLGVSTSHVSRAITQLETRIQAPVFFRTTRKIALTDTGRVLLEHCRRIIQERDEALALASGGGEAHGEVRMTCPPALGERFVAPVVRQFVRDNPRISIQLDLTDHVTDLITGGYDLAIRSGQMADSRLIGVKIASRRFLTCASPAYLDNHGRLSDIEDLKAHSCLVGNSPIWRFKSGRERIELRPKGRLRCNNGQVITDAALAGMGVCHLPEFYVRRHLDNGELEAVLENFADDEEPIWAVYPERRHLLPKVRNLVERLKFARFASPFNS
jgi:DNA-binding transcriptional LysR family regulator